MPLSPPDFLPGYGRRLGGSTRKDQTAPGEDLHKGATKIFKDVLDSAGFRQQIPLQIRSENSKKKVQGNEGRKTTRGKDRRTRPEQYGGVDGCGGVCEDAAEHR